MAKQAKTAIKAKGAAVDADAKSFTKVIRAVRSPKSGAYSFKESIVHKGNVKEFFSKK